MKVLVFVKATKDTEAGIFPTGEEYEKLLSEMAAYHEDLKKAGVLLDGSGLQPSSKGWRIAYSGAKRTVIDGPFAEAKELVAGFWIIQVRSKAEAIEWMMRCPCPTEGDGEVEIRQVFETEDFPAGEWTEAEQRMRAQLAKQ